MDKSADNASTSEASQLLRALLECEERFRRLFERTSDRLLLIEGATILDGNPAAAAALGCSDRTAMRGVALTSLFPAAEALSPEALDRFARGQSADGSTSRRVVVICRPPAGDEYLAEVELATLPVGGSQVIQLAWRGVDAASPPQPTSSSPSKAVSDIQQTAVVAERNRIARELHDAVTQTLFSASLIAEVLPTLWQRDPQLGEARLQELRELTRGALAEMRSLLLELRPRALDESSLSDLLLQLAEGVIGRWRLPVLLSITGNAEPESEVKIAFYRIAQESLNNVVRHSGAKRVDLSLRREGDALEMVIQDDGRGFDPALVGSKSLGLGILRERAAGIGAGLTIESERGRGTRIAVRHEPGRTQS